MWRIAKKALVTYLVTPYTFYMRIISKKPLREFWIKYPDAEQPLKSWHGVVRSALWRSPAEVKVVFRNESLVGSNRVVFNIAGNKYRLVVFVKYSIQRVYVCFIGTHSEYDKIDVSEV